MKYLCLECKSPLGFLDKTEDLIEIEPCRYCVQQEITLALSRKGCHYIKTRAQLPDMAKFERS